MDNTGTRALTPEALFMKSETRQGVVNEERGWPIPPPRAQNKTRSQENFLTVRIIEKWSSLSQVVKSANNVKQFKRAAHNGSTMLPGAEMESSSQV